MNQPLTVVGLSAVFAVLTAFTLKAEAAIAHPLPFPFASDLWEAPTWQQ